MTRRSRPVATLAAILAGLLAAAGLSPAPGQADSHAVIRVGTEGVYPPYNFVGDDGKLAGFDIDVGTEVCARAGLTCEWVVNDWDSIIPNLVAGNYDVIIAGMSITESRDAVIDFTETYGLPDASTYAALSADLDLATARVAVQVNTVSSAYIAGTGAVMVEYPDPDDTVAAVLGGEADAVFADREYLQPFVDQTPGLVFLGGDVFIGDGTAMGVRESDAALRETLSAAIRSMKEDGTLNRLIETWLPGAATF